MRIFVFTCLFSLIAGFTAAQETVSRGSIPEELLRPMRDEASRYPIDTVIGHLGQGEASDAAFSYANYIAAGFVSGQMNHSSLTGINPVLRESYLSAINEAQPENYRIGGGREEPDGSVSFLIRFIGKEFSITGELFVRFITRHIQEVKAADEDGEEEDEIIPPPITSGSWTLEEILLEEPMKKEEQSAHHSVREFFDFLPYERFF